MNPEKNYSASARAAKTHKIIKADQLIRIMKGEDSSYIKNYDWVEIENHIIIDFVRLQDFTTDYKLKIKDCYFESHLSLEGAIFPKMVSFIDCRFEKAFQIDKCEFKDRFEIFGLYITAFWISGGFFNEVVVRGYSDLIRFWIQGGKFKQFTFTGDDKDPVLEEFVIYNTEGLEGNVKLEKIVAKKVSLHGVNSATGELSFEDIKCDCFQISNFSNSGIIKVFGLSPSSYKQSYFQLVKSNLGKAQLFRISFADFEEVIFVDSFLAEINIINCEWASNFRGIESSDYYITERARPRASTAESKQLKEFFRQLKFIYDRQGDKINENYFYSHEMNTYNSLISWKLIWFKPWSETFWEKVIILGSKYLSNYGKSFIIPLLGIAVFNFTILVILIHFFNYQGLDLAGFSTGEKDANRLAVGEFFKLINPVHKMDEGLTGWAVFWDLFARVSASYFLYNLIRSSRRFLR